jgi:CubicO group peptidase (beta-lactamase class C family)
MLRLLIVVATLTLAMSARQADTPEAAKPPSAAELASKADKVFEKFNSTMTPGCALSVIRSGKIVYKRGYGMADLDHDVPIRPETVFHVASISKQFTDASIVLLAREGKLSLDDDVRKYVPELPDFGTPITIRHLIHHTSGLRDQWSLLGLAGWRYSLDLITDQDVLDVMSAQKELNFKPGEKHVYCNTGYTLLAQIVKRVSGKSFREFTTERIFQPLGMTSTHFRDDHAEVVKHIAYGYERGKSEDEFKLSVTNFDTVGATSLLTTVEDLALWDENFYTPRVGDADFVRQMLTKGKLNNGEELDYAFGLQYGKYRALPTIDHGGADAGYRADFLRFPNQHFSVACLCNLAQANPGDLARKVADVYLAGELKDEAGKTVAEERAVSLTAPQLAAFAGLYWNKEEQNAIRVAFKEGKLSTVFSPDDIFEMKPTAENRFRLSGLPITMEFKSVQAGAPPSMFFRNDAGGNAHTLDLVQEFKPGPAQLVAFAGVYRSEELEPVYRIVVEDGSLILKRLKAKPDRLVPTISDYFSTSSGSLHFVRDSKGQVTGFVLNAGRIQGLQFKRSSRDLIRRCAEPAPCATGHGWIDYSSVA